MIKKNLANVYAYLLNLCGEQYIVSYSLPPTYLQNIIGTEEENEKIVFVYKEERKASARDPIAVTPTKLNIQSNLATDLDLTGSPLKDDCEVDANISIDLNMDTVTIWRPEEEFHRGLPVNKARNIICTEDFQNQPQSGNDLKGSVWILCDAADAEKSLFLQYEFNSQFFSRGVVTFTGLVCTKAFPSVQTLMRNHFSTMRPGTPVETFVENVYRIKSDQFVRCSWSTSSAVPTLIDLISTDVTLSQTFRLGDCSPLTQDFVNQLRTLMRMRDDIISYKESAESNPGKEPIYRCGVGPGLELDVLREDINKIMGEVSGLAEPSSHGEIEYDIEAVVQMARVRRLNDLTDNLWNILKRSSSYKDLKAAFHILFQCAARCNIVNIPTNKNHLAEIITEVSNRRLAIPCLTGVEPIELLLEIGMEKLYKDYEFIFTESKICSPNTLKNASLLKTDDLKNGNAFPSVRMSLRNAVQTEAVTPRKTLLHNAKGFQKKTTKEIIGFRNSNFDEDASAAQLSKLLQIHCILEHLLMIQINLNLQNVYSDVCEQLLNKPLKLITKTIEDSFIDQVDISISAHNVREHLEGKDPFSRRITFKSKNKLRQVKTTVFYSMENVCPPGVSQSFDTDEKEISKESTYHCWVYRKIQTLK